jgi:hypothetical protein
VTAVAPNVPERVSRPGIETIGGSGHELFVARDALWLRQLTNFSAIPTVSRQGTRYDMGRMRWLGRIIVTFQAVLLAICLAAPLSPLPDIPAIPDGTDVKVVSSTATTVYATGIVRGRVLSMTTSSGKLPRNEKIQLWVGIPVAGAVNDKDVKSISAVTSSSGADILITEGGARVSLTQVLREVYGIRFEMR